MASVRTIEPSPMDDYICKGREKQLKLLWQIQNPSAAVDIAFLCDRSLLYILQPTDPEDHIKQLHALEASGRPCDLPFSVALKSPQSVSSTNEGKTIVILDRIYGDESCIYVFQKERSRSPWLTTNTIDVVLMQWLDKVCSVSASQFSCTTYVDNLVVAFNERGKKSWEYRLAEEYPNIEGKCIDTDPDGNLVVSCPKHDHRNGSTILIDKNGRIINMFPPELLHDPRGVCFTGKRHLIVADWGSDGVFLFSSDWVFIRKVVSLDKKPTCLALLNDKLLAIAFEDGTIKAYSI